MKSKKGFTLVELLAVIAILAILVIIALPNVMKMFRESRQNSFENEVKNIYRTAQSQYLIDSMANGNTQTYSNLPNCGTELDLSGRKNIKYVIRFNADGKVTEVKVSDGNYKYENNNTTDGIEISNIGKSTVSSDQITCN